MGNVMNMPETFEEFIKEYSFKDKKRTLYKRRRVGASVPCYAGMGTL